MIDEQQKGVIFNIQKFSVHDGKGIRTIVFFKGCPLNCKWCSNPESQKMQPEHAFNHMRCIGADVCGRCIGVCQSGAMQLENGRFLADMSKCKQCLQCANACPSGAQTLYGESKTVSEILRRVEEDGVFYARSGGGLTLSGGEVLAQPQFAVALLREARRRHIHTAVETCGLAPYKVIAEACQYLNELIFDVKHSSSVKHKEFTGVDNTIVLENLKQLAKDFPNLPITVRTPVVPGFNDTWEEISDIFSIIPKGKNIRYELLEYHRMGEPKYEYLGREFPYKGIVADKSLMQKLQANLAKEYPTSVE